MTELTFPRAYNAASDFVDRNIAEGRADKPAFIDPDRELTYGALQNQSRRFANALRHLRVEPEQRLALIMLNSVAMPVAFWGAIRAGVVPVPLNTLLTTDQYKYILGDARATALVISRALLPKVEPLIAELPALHTVIVSDGEAPGYGLGFEQLLEESTPEAPTADTCCDGIAFWLYSSGSTGRPKSVKHLHSSLMQTADLYGRQVLGITENDVVFSAAKLFFAYGLGNAMSFPMSVGATAILHPGRPTPDTVLEVMGSRNPSLFFGVPTLYSALLAHPGLGRGAGSKNLKLCVSAGEALPKEIGERWLQSVGVDILDGIGSTELLHIFISNRPGQVVYGSSGVPVPGYEARIIDADGNQAADGEIGELLVSGPSAGEGYWNQRDKTRATFVGKWTHTGDNYRRGADGLYYYCGRSDDMFKVSGNWVSPFEVKSALMSHDVVLEAAVVGAEDAEGLVKPKAFIVLKGGFEPYDGLITELKEHVKTVAGPWKYPRWIEIMDDLPKTATGKIQRFKLRQDAPRDAAE